MGATKILQALGNGDKLTTVDISEILDCGLPALRQSIKRLTHAEDLEFRPLTKEEKIEKYGRNIGCKIYIYWINK